MIYISYNINLSYWKPYISRTQEFKKSRKEYIN